MFGKHPRRIGMGLAIAVGIASASMSASKPHKTDGPAAADRTAPHATLILPLN